MRRQAFLNLIAAGTNALIEEGMSLSFEDVSDEQKVCLTQTEEAGFTTVFDFGGVRSCATSKPSGHGEERIVVLYDSTDVNTAQDAVGGALYLMHVTSNITMAMATLERERGPYIMDQRRIDSSTFKCRRAHLEILSNAVVVPNGYELNGPFIF